MRAVVGQQGFIPGACVWWCSMAQPPHTFSWSFTCAGSVFLLSADMMFAVLQQVSGFYSDLLHQPWLCATVELQPHWLEVDNIDRCVNS